MEDGAKDFIAGVTAGIALVGVGHPFDTVKVKLQAQQQGSAAKFRGPLDCTSYILRNEGVRGLYKGATSSFIGVAVESSILFGTYSQITTALQGGSRSAPSTSTVVTAAAVSGAAVSLVLCPTELIKCRLQVQDKAAAASTAAAAAAAGGNSRPASIQASTRPHLSPGQFAAETAAPIRAAVAADAPAALASATRVGTAAAASAATIPAAAVGVSGAPIVAFGIAGPVGEGRASTGHAGLHSSRAGVPLSGAAGFPESNSAAAPLSSSPSSSLRAGSSHGLSAPSRWTGAGGAFTATTRIGATGEGFGASALSERSSATAASAHASAQGHLRSMGGGGGERMMARGTMQTQTRMPPMGQLARGAGLPSAELARGVATSAVATPASVPLSTHYNGPWDCLVKTLRAEGAQGLFRGIQATALRESIGNVCFFLTYEATKQRVTRLLSPSSTTSSSSSSSSSTTLSSLSSSPSSSSCAIHGDHSPSSGAVAAVDCCDERSRSGSGGVSSGDGDGSSGSSAVHGAVVEAISGVVSGGLAGIAFWTAVLPLDVVKTQIQTGTCAAGVPASASLSAHLKALYAQSGLRGLYAGLGPTLMRAFPANAAAVVAWELTARLLGVGRG